ncbi:glycosyltransferase family 1 protein [Candidatus Microgenomates bacterium]|nr:MAG: glycosyltransferase family 1 protein [Candidatus Microgenomates bacterium]
MKVALIQSSQVNNEQRGVGVYTQNLFNALKTLKDIQVEITQLSDIPKDADIYHYTYFDPFFKSLKIIPGKKTIVTVHDLIPIKFPTHFPKGIRGTINWWRQKKNLQNADALITDSLASQKDIRQLVKIPESRIYPIYLAPGVPFYKKFTTTQLKNVSHKYSLPEKYVLYVGDANWNKNILNVVKACEQAEVALVLVSNALSKTVTVNHPELREARLAQQILVKNAQFLVLSKVAVEDLAALYQLAQVLLLPSRYEGFGLPVVEAFASGCPVICSKNGSLAEVAGKGAYFIDSDDGAAISAAVKKFYTDSQVRQKYRKLGYQEVKRFSWESTALKTFDVYKQIKLS